MERKHSERCEAAKPESRCRCSCDGRLHGRVNEIPQDDGVAVGTGSGGELGDFIKSLEGKTVQCFCRAEMPVAGWSAHKVEDGGSGLKDAQGQTWWPYIHCGQCGYDMAYWKVERRVREMP